MASDRAPGPWPLVGIATAVTWFTRLPAPRRWTTDRLDLALGWLPLVGLVVAGVGITVRAATEPLVGELAAAVLLVAAAVAVTGAFHEDGLADTFDGLWGGMTRERRLEILRDSRLGTYGVAALTLSLLLRVALLAPLSLGDTARALIAAEVAGRAVVVPLLAVLPPARPDGQLAGFGRVRASAAVTAAVVTAAALIAATGVWAPAVVVAATGGAGLVTWAAQRRLGGLTGDVLGAANQAAHLAVLATVAAIARQEVGWGI